MSPRAAISSLLVLAACAEEETSRANRPPAILAQLAQTVAEGTLLAFSVAALDPDGDSVMVSVEGVPDGAKFNAESGQFLWIPGYRQAGDYVLDLAATDGRLTVGAKVEVTVLDTNRPPVLDTVTDLVAQEGQPVTARFMAADPDGDPLVLGAAPLPEGAEFDAPSGALAWTPSFDQAGRYLLVVTAAEARDFGLIAQAPLRIVVRNVNRPPVFADPPALTVREGQTLDVVFSASDPDGDPVDVLATDLPDGAAFEPTSRRLTWTPALGQAGTHPLALAASDRHEPAAEALAAELQLVAVVQPGNRPPLLDAVSEPVVAEGDTIVLRLEGLDQDTDQALEYGVLGEPPGASLEGAIFTWTPGCNAAGTYTVLFTVSDGQASSSRVVRITVLEGNCPPRIGPIGPRTVREGDRLAFVVPVLDEDASGFVFSAAGAPGAAVDPVTGLFTWTPDHEQAGVYAVELSVVDQGAPPLSDSATETITVLDENRPPAFDPVTGQTVREGQEAQVLVLARDPDGDAITEITAAGRPIESGGRLEPIAAPGGLSARLTWTPSCADGGAGVVDYPVTFQARDARGGAGSTVATVSVRNVDCPPALGLTWEKDGLSEDGEIVLSVTADDPDGFDVIRLAAEGGPLLDTHPDDGLRRRRALFEPDLDLTGGTFTWRPGCLDQGAYQVTFSALDATGQESVLGVPFEIARADCRASISAPALAAGAEGSDLTFLISVVDPESETEPALDWGPRPLGAAVDREPDQPGLWRLWWRPSCTQAGSYRVAFSAAAALETVSDETAIEIAGVNCPPTLTGIVPWTSPEEGRTVTLCGENLLAGTHVIVDGVTEPVPGTPAYTADCPGVGGLLFEAPPRAAPAIVEVTIDNHQGVPIPPPLQLRYYRLTPVAGGPEWGRARALAASSLDPLLFAMLFNNLFYLSRDGGLSWSPRGAEPWPFTPQTVVPWEFLAFDADSASTLYYAGPTGAGYAGILLRSTNLGRGWSRLSAPMTVLDPGKCGGYGAPLPPYSGLAPAAGGGVYLASSVSGYQACQRGLWRYQETLEGPRWVQLHHTEALPYQAVASAPSDREQVFLITQAEGSFRSTNGGQTWDQASDPDAVVRDLAFDPQEPERLFALTANGLRESADFGFSWSNPLEFAGRGRLAVARAAGAPDPALFVSGDDGVESSTDGGRTVRLETIPATLRKVVAAAAAPGLLRAVAGFEPASAPGRTGLTTWSRPLPFAALATLDGGDTWTDASRGLAGAVDALVATRAGAMVLLSAGRIYHRQPGQPAFARSAIPTESVVDLAASEGQSDIVFALGDSATDWVYRSTDGGRSFALAKDATPRYGMTLATIPGPPAAVYVLAQSSLPATGNPPSRWLMKSVNEGATWTATTVPNTLGVYALTTELAVDPVDPSWMWMTGTATFAGLFSSTDAGLSWTSVGPGGGLLIDRHGTSRPRVRLVFSGGQRNLGGGDPLWWAPTRSGFKGQLHPPRAATFLAGSFDGLYLTSDRGAHWRKLYIQDRPVYSDSPWYFGSQAVSIVEDPLRPGTVYFATKSDTPSVPAYGAGAGAFELELVWP